MWGLFSVDLSLPLCFLFREVPLAFALKLVLNSLNFCLSGKLLISPSNLMSLTGKSFLGCSFFPFITLNISCHPLLTCRVSIEKSADNSLMGVLLYLICHFSLVAFNILSLSLIFVSLITVRHVPPWVHPSLDSVLPGLGWLFPFPMFEKFSTIISSYIFLGPTVMSDSL